MGKSQDVPRERSSSSKVTRPSSAPLRLSTGKSLLQSEPSRCGTRSKLALLQVPQQPESREELAGTGSLIARLPVTLASARWLGWLCKGQRTGGDTTCATWTVCLSVQKLLAQHNLEPTTERSIKARDPFVCWTFGQSRVCLPFRDLHYFPIALLFFSWSLSYFSLKTSPLVYSSLSVRPSPFLPVSYLLLTNFISTFPFVSLFQTLPSHRSSLCLTSLS